MMPVAQIATPGPNDFVVGLLAFFFLFIGSFLDFISFDEDAYGMQRP
jgi:hypothetical protein